MLRSLDEIKKYASPLGHFRINFSFVLSSLRQSTFKFTAGGAVKVGYVVVFWAMIQVLDIRIYTNPFFFLGTYFSGRSTYSDLAAPTSTTSPKGYAVSAVFVWVAAITMGTATRRPALDSLSLMHCCIFLITMCATVRTKLGPTGLATAAGVNNFLGKNKDLTRILVIVTAECLPCLRGTEWYNLQCVFIWVQRGVILCDETAVYSFNFPHMTHPLVNQIIYSSEHSMFRKAFERGID